MVNFKHLQEMYDKKNLAYGDAYNKFGAVMEVIFPDGLNIERDYEWVRLGIFIQFIEKALRIGNLTFNAPEAETAESMQDSCDDLSILGQIMKEVM